MTTKPKTKKAKSKTLATARRNNGRPAAKGQFTAAMLAAKKKVSPKAVRAFLRRHFESPKNGEGWRITKTMADQFLAA